jgi:hypothetical protein
MNVKNYPMPLGQKVFIIIGILSFFIVGYKSYSDFGYGNGAWHLNKTEVRPSQILLTFLIPFFFLLTAYMYKIVSKNGINVSKKQLLAHIAISILCLLALCFLSLPIFIKNQSQFSSVYSRTELPIFKWVSYSVMLIQLIFLFGLRKKIIQKLQ